MTTKQLLDTYYDGLAKKQGWEAVIADDFKFIGGDMTKTEPLNGKQAYAETINRFSKIFTNMRVKEMFVEDNKASVLANYDYIFPNGKKTSGDVAEFWKIKNGKLDTLTINFDTLTFSLWTNSQNIVLGYYHSWTSNDFVKAGDYLSDDLEVIVPINSYPDKHSFLKAVEYTRQMITDIQIISTFSNENDALLLYDMILNDFGKLKVAEYFKVENGKIIQICQVHDTAPFRRT